MLVAEPIGGRGVQTTPCRRRTATCGTPIDAGLRLFGDVTAISVSIGDITGAAQVSKQTFYNHFTDKMDLL